MNGLPIEAVIVLLGIGIVVLLWLAMRFGRVIALFLAGAGILVAIVLGVGALGTQAAANLQTATVAREAVEAVKVQAVGQSITSVIVALGVGLALGGMGIVTLGAVGVAGWAAVSYRLAERDNKRMLGERQRQRLPEGTQAGQVIYITDDVDAGVDLAGLDLAGWGW
jgi:hypothetical protein